MFLSYLHTLWATTWADNSLAGRIIVVLVLFLLLRSIIAGSWHVNRYKRENINLAKVVKLLRQIRSVPPPSAGEDAQVTAAARRSVPIPVERLEEGIDSASLIFDRISAIKILRAHQVKVNVAALQQMSLAKDASQPGMSTPAFNAGMAMMLGLLGTFLGLAVMAQQIQFALPSGLGEVALDHAVEDVRSVLSGIKTAFSTSLAGMICAIISNLLSFSIRQRQNAFFERLERFTTEELLPATVPSVEDETLLDEVNRQLRESFDELKTVSLQNREALQEMTAAEAAFASIVEEIRKITKSEASRDLENVISLLVSTNGAVVQLVQQVPAIARAFEHRSDRLLEKIAETRANPIPARRPLFSVSMFLGLVAAMVLFLWLLRAMA